jgi:hypothetical protein
MKHSSKNKLPSMKIKRYWGSSQLTIETNNRNGNNYLLIKMDKGPLIQRGKHFYYITFGNYKFNRLRVIGVDLIDY